ncbi:nickel ABC transporter permease [Fuchsiella alkaliacetigena]|uniref:nickel ABC transporter permease n=1 Tax=Fuchsiella alkaliacetigena TaxID=957042 RepID=UPI00200B606B|nr:nickel ABC transporter permease [Fuchsiella alkaliacetigena]MCK8825585.1 ABC transporter permease [Fuchsiella alkaliacetigena]
MFNYILKRILYLLVIMFIISILTFSLSRLVPGDPAEVILRSSGVEPTQEAVESMRENLGLNQPVVWQYIDWLGGILQWDFGRSFTTGRPVIQEIWYRFPATLELALAGVVVMFCLSFPAGIISAVFKNTYLDHLGRFLALVGASFPSYWLGLLLIYFFGVQNSLLPVMGRGTGRHLILPAFTLGLGMAAVYARLLRANLLEVLNQDYIRTARAKGLSEKAVVLKHALKNALLPVITAFGVNFGYLLGGTVIIETIFNWPGLGKFVVEAIFNRDYPVLQAYVLFMALVFVTINTLVDIIYGVLDPRIASERRN